MTNTENTALQMIAEAARCPDYGPDMVKALMEKLDMNEKGFALLMNVAPSTVRLWTSGAAQLNIIPLGSHQFPASEPPGNFFLESHLRHKI